MASKRDDYLNKMLGDGAAAKLDEGIDALIEFLSANGVEHKAQGEADPQETAKEAVANAEKAFKLLMPELIESQAALMERQDELETANKSLTDENETLKTKTADELKELRETVAELQTQLAGRPRSASRAAETEVNKSELSEAAQEAIEQSTTEVDPFWARRKRMTRPV
jgi:chromosome segregation ATPase